LISLSRGAAWGLALACVFVSARPASAVLTSTWTVETYEQWNEGEARNAFITSLGEVRPGWSTDRLELALEGIWSALLARDGSVLLGTDQDATVYRVRDRKVAKLAAIPDAIAVVSLAQGADGTIYAGTMPGGEVWKIDAGGKPSKLARLARAETVWALALGKDGKTLYAGTGPEGELHAIEVRTGKARVAFQSEDKRILSVVAAPDGAIWLGTSEKAMVFRHDPGGNTTRAIGDFAGNEITAMAPWAEGVIVCANEFEEPSTTGMKTKAAIDKARKDKKTGEKPDMPEAGSKPGADKTAPAGTEPARKGERKGKGALYRVYADGRLEQLHALTTTYFSDVEVTGDGRIFAGAGDKGRVYLVDTDDSVSTAFDVEERIVAALLLDARAGADQGLHFATSDAAALYRTTGRSRNATYTSEVFDTKAPSRFGKLLWYGSEGVTVQTRTGNTAEPGKGWSAFQAPGKPGRGGGQSSAGEVASPAGRYVQFRAELKSGDAVLRQARLYYLPQNTATRITGIEIKNTAAKSGITLQTGATPARSPVIELKWKVENPDSDQTEYVLEVRRDGEALWRPLRQQPLTTASFEWNTETFPDGWYRLRVTANDRRANASDRVREHTRTSNLFVVDNQRPTIGGLQVTYPRATAKASDAMSAIAEVAFAVDDGPWLIGGTTDGLFDSSEESLRMELPRDLGSGIHTLSVRVADEAGNIGAASLTFQVK
jgi:outer membrane protein assembly factor BamB